MVRICVLLYCLSLVFMVGGCAPPPSPPDIKTSFAEEVEIPPLQVKEYIIGFDDELEIKVWRHSDLNALLTVDRNGMVDIPMVGAIRAANMGLLQFRDTVTYELDKYIVDPQVTITVEAAQSKKVYVLGEVRSPGVYVSEDSLSIAETIAMAGGFTLNARKSQALLFRKAHDGKLNTLILDLDAMRVGDEKLFTELQKGDIIYVPRSTTANVVRFANQISQILAPIITAQHIFVLYPTWKDVVTGDYDD